MIISRFLDISVTLLLLFIIGVNVVPFSYANKTQPRNTQWFEGQIDEFIRNAQDTGEATDIQVSTCKITSQQLVATAQATAARVLKGICNPAEIEDRFHNLETQLGDQLNVLKSMLLSLEDKLVEQDQEIKKNQRRTMSVLAGIRKTDGSGSTVIDDSTSYTPAYVPVIPHRAQEVIDDDDDVGDDESPSYRRLNDNDGDNGEDGFSSGDVPLSSSDINTKNGRVGPRSAEISRYNSTVYIENGKRVFSYYWIVTGMSYKLKNWNQQRVLRSNSFYIFQRGYRMYIKMIPKYSSTTMFLHVGITKGDYDQELEWPFTSKMRVAIPDQNQVSQGVQDLKSRMWDPKELCSGSNWVKPVVGDNPECVGLGIPHSVIKTRNYIWNDRMIIKLNVFLD